MSSMRARSFFKWLLAECGARIDRVRRVAVDSPRTMLTTEDIKQIGYVHDPAARCWTSAQYVKDAVDVWDKTNSLLSSVSLDSMESACKIQYWLRRQNWAAAGSAPGFYATAEAEGPNARKKFKMLASEVAAQWVR
eukprot:6224177-Amphidinium_carterae.1